jgi:hypothetical protein
MTLTKAQLIELLPWLRCVIAESTAVTIVTQSGKIVFEFHVADFASTFIESTVKP